MLSNEGSSSYKGFVNNRDFKSGMSLATVVTANLLLPRVRPRLSVVHHQVNSVSAREQLAQSIRDLTAALAERHATLTQALEAARQKRGEALSGQVAERRSLMEHAGLMAFTQELLKETDPPCFVQAARQTHNRFGYH